MSVMTSWFLRIVACIVRGSVRRGRRRVVQLRCQSASRTNDLDPMIKGMTWTVGAPYALVISRGRPGVHRPSWRTRGGRWCGTGGIAGDRQGATDGSPGCNGTRSGTSGYRRQQRGRAGLRRQCCHTTRATPWYEPP
eukprot:1265987-Rhodomonas_salina.1